MTSTDQVLIFDVDPQRSSSTMALLERADPSRKGAVRAFSGLGGGRVPSAGLQALQAGQAALALVVEDDAFSAVADAARRHGVATLLVADTDRPEDLAGRVREYDSWMSLDAIDRELPARVEGLLARRPKGSTPLPAIDHRFLALVIHDLRTPLNVIGLTIRAISQTVPQKSAEFDEDLIFLTDNARQIEKMLAQLGDFCRLIEAESPPSAVEFDPRRFLSDFLEDRRGRSSAESTTARLEFADDAPTEVALDPQRVRLALQHALANAMNAAGEVPVRIRSRGGPGRWMVEMIVDKPPPATTGAMELRPDRFERLAGTAAERRGLDLAIAARVSELFGGSARLEVEPGSRTSVVLDWPARLEGA